ncbi:MAG TPA: hypothetical protein VK541_09180 [Pedobacter sp.]|uniref:hypothetical protein n=1 Tax=Pedobacter sp. TaxID=1411316 RepID=UPI002C250C85|nr:hypothetical protein [Pedobacter sp.]HMI02641.1 hypothetical protein [Pedobacter sp.]
MLLILYPCFFCWHRHRLGTVAGFPGIYLRMAGTPHDLSRILQTGAAEFLIKASFEEGGTRMDL